MPVYDMVIDTNVLMHASNPNEGRFEHAVQFLERLLQVATLLCVDEGFDVLEAKNRSLIGAEYLNNLVHGALGHTVVTHLAKSGRMSVVPRQASRPQTRVVTQMIRKPRDRTFVRVAINSRDHVFVSHDYNDFSNEKRQDIQASLGVTMPDAQQAFGMLG